MKTVSTFKSSTLYCKVSFDNAKFNSCMPRFQVQSTQRRSFRTSIVHKEAFEPIKGYPWNTSLNITGWWASLKKNGVRGISDGRGNVYSVTGKPIIIPEWFQKLLKGIIVDGEFVYQGVKSPDKITSIVKKTTPDPDEWANVLYYIFDAPKHGGNYAERHAYLRTYFQPHANLRIIPINPVEGTMHLLYLMQQAHHNGEPGLVLRSPIGPYVQGRSETLLKVKVLQRGKAKVIGYKNSKLVLQMNNGKKFEIASGTSIKKLLANYPIGTMASYVYYDRHSQTKIPRSPRLDDGRYGADSEEESEGDW